MNNQTIAQFLGIKEFPYVIKDAKGKEIYYETSNGLWYKYEFDANGNVTFFETSKGYWEKSEFDSKGNVTYYETSTGYWEKWEYNANGFESYYESSNGTIRDNRPKQVELTMADIASKLNIPLAQLRIKE